MSHSEPKTNNVFKLLNSLSKNEKGYIKKYSKIFVNTENSKLKIYYTIIEKMKVFDEIKLKKELEKHGGVSLFKNIKNTLFHQLLEDLMLLKISQSNSKNYFIEHLKLNYLFEKGMYDLTLDYYKSLDRTREESSSIMANYMYTTFQYYHTFLLGNVKEIDPELVQRMDIAFDEIAIYKHLLKAVANYQYTKIQSQKLSKENQLKIYKEFHDQYLIHIPKNFQSKTIKLISTYYTLFLDYSRQVDDHESYNYYAKSFYGIFDTQEKRIQHNHSFANSILDFANTLVLKNDPLLYEILEDFEIFVFQTKHSNNLSYLKTMFFQISINSYIGLNDKIALKKLVTKYQTEIKNMNFELITKTIIGTNLLFLTSFFVLKKYKETNTFLEILLSKKSKETAPEYYYAARLIDIMIHFELKNMDSLPYFIKNLKADILGFKTLTDQEIEIFRILSKLSKETDLKKSKLMGILYQSTSDQNLPTYIKESKIHDWAKSYAL